MVNNNKNALKVILCGSHYGAVYLPILAGLDTYKLEGIYSRGSARSASYCHKLSIENYTQLESIPGDIDLVVIAIGSETGPALAEHFLRRQMHVLIEHPITWQHVKDLFSIARENNATFMVNSHFRYTQAIQSFIEKTKVISPQTCSPPPKAVVASASTRTLFSLLDALIECFGNCTSGATKTSAITGYETWLIPLEHCHVFLTLQVWQDEVDSGRDISMGHCIQAYYTDRCVQLSGTWGPVIELHQPNNVQTPTLCNAIGADIDAKSVFNDRRRANITILNEMVNSIETGHAPFEQSPEHLSAVAKLWQTIIAQ